jgi:hypothetical protein
VRALRGTTARRALASVVAVVLLAGCSDDGGADDDGATLGDTAAPTSVTAPAVPAASPPGSGVVVLGGSQSRFTVTECQLTAGADPATLVLVTGAGTSANGVPFQVEVRRAASAAAAETFTDTITYTDTARIFQLQRFEVAGEVSDLRDPSARGTLLRVRADGLSASGLAGPPGTGADLDEGIVGMALDASC